MRYRKRFIVVPVIMVSVVALVTWWCVPAKPLQAHTGDGDFADLSRKVRLIGNMTSELRGFSVSMPRFDLGQAYHAEYRIARLPNIRRDCRLYLAIHDADDVWGSKENEIRALRGTLRFEIVNKHGVRVCEAEGPLSQWGWGHWCDAQRLGKHPGCSFRAREDEAYTLRISYSGEPALAGMSGFCYLECGARK